MAVADAARVEWRVVATALVLEAAVGTAQVHVHPVAERVLLHQQPARLSRVEVDQARMEPERTGLEAERGIRRWQRLESSLLVPAAGGGKVGLAIEVVEVPDVGR